jgi:hypothetical protein
VTTPSSLFAKLRDAALSLGRSERTATRNARLLESALFADFRRLAPAENVKLGLSPKARHYVLSATKRLTTATPTVSARQFETKRAGALFGLSPEKATEARRQGAISYTSAEQRERVAKAARTRETTKIVAEIKRRRAAGDHVPSNSRDKRRHGRSYAITPDAGERYRELRQRKLAGQHIPNGEWHWFIDYARRFKDPRYELLRGSPGAFGFTVAF